MSPYTLTYRTSAMTEAALVLEFDHDKTDWAEACNRTFERLHPGVPFSTRNEQAIAKYLKEPA